MADRHFARVNEKAALYKSTPTLLAYAADVIEQPTPDISRQPRDPAGILQLQRMIGNQATQQLLQNQVIQREDDKKKTGGKPYKKDRQALKLIEQSLLPSLKSALEARNSEYAKQLLMRILSNQTLMVVLSKDDFGENIGDDLKGIFTLGLTKGLVRVEILNRYRAIGRELDALADQYDNDYILYSVFTLYREAKINGLTLREQMVINNL